MKLREFLFLAVVQLLYVITAVAQTGTYDDVMLVVNDRSWASKQIGAYFALHRGIPERHICHIDVDSSETIDSARFLPVKWQIQSWMAQQGIVDSVNYIVTTKGCPLRVTTSVWDHSDSISSYLGGQASFEDCLALINGTDSTLILSVKTTGFPTSRYFRSKDHFRRDPVALPMYLVTRLDAYTVEQVIGYLDRATHPAVVGDGLWVLDVDPGKDGDPNYKIGNDWLRGASSALKGLNVLINQDTLYVRAQKNVIGYASWGSNDSHSGGGAAAKPGNTWLDGSIAETYVSTGGRSFMPGATYGQSLVADWIAEGACGVKGYTDEPYLTAIAHPDILFDRYIHGFNMAESFFAASQYCAWRQVVVGDPKMMLGTIARLSTAMLDFGQMPRHTSVLDTLWFYNTQDASVILSSIALVGTTAGTSQLDFSIAPSVPDLPVIVRAHDSLPLVLLFDASAYGKRTADATVSYRRPGDTSDVLSTVELIGTVLKPTLVTPAVVAFSGIAAGQQATRTIEISNDTPSDTITITNVTLTGTGASLFGVDPSGSMSHTLIAGESWRLTVTYTGSAADVDTATLRIASNANGSPTRVGLVGRRASGVSDEASVDVTAAIALESVPNPFEASSELRYHLPAPGARVTIELIDQLGRTVAKLLDGYRAGGEGRVAIDGAGLAPGVYLCRMTATTSSGRVSSVIPLVRR